VYDMMYMDDKLLPAMGGVVDFYGGRGTPWGDFQENMIIGRSGPVHARLRASVAMAFTPRNANQHRLQMRQVISGLLDEWAPRGQFDFTLFASYFPVSVLCSVLGTSAEPIPRIRDNLEIQGLVISMDRKIFPQLVAALEAQWAFVDSLVKEREKRGHLESGALLDDLILAMQRGDLDRTELNYMLIVLFVAGYDTSKNMLGLILYTLLDRPDDWRKCAEDIGFCRKVVEEMFRHTSITTPPRIVAEDFGYDGIQFKKGESIFFANSLTGRDPSVFPDPMTFDPEREHKTRHIAFGRGVHLCLGQHLARTQLEEGLHVIAQRLRNPRLVGEVTWRPFLGVWGLNTLPIAFEAA
jgi:cytochrome P450